MVGAINSTLIMATCVGCFILGFTCKAILVDAGRARELEEAMAAKQAVEFEKDVAEQKLATLRAEQGHQAKVIVKKVNHEIEKVVYRECVVPDDGVRLINEQAGLYATR